MDQTSKEEDTLAVAIERIFLRLSEGQLSGEVIREESVRCQLSIATVETMLRLDQRFARTAMGWDVQSQRDRWVDLARALPVSLGEPAASEDLFRQVLLDLSPSTRADLLRFYPTVSLPDRYRRRLAQLVSTCPDECLSRLKGPVFDLAMAELFDDPQRNRFFTPRLITAFVVAWLAPQLRERILDPCYGSGGFLLAAVRYLSLMQVGSTLPVMPTDLLAALLPGTLPSALPPDFFLAGSLDQNLYGLEIDPAAQWSGSTNLELHGISTGNLHQANGLDVTRLPVDWLDFDVVAGNPSFGDKIDTPEILEQYELGHDAKGQRLPQQSSEVLFVEAFLRFARPGGRVAILLPDGILSNSAHQPVRDFLAQHAFVDGIIALPRRVFRNDAKSNVLLLRRKASADEVQTKEVFLATVQKLQTDLAEVLARYLAGPASL